MHPITRWLFLCGLLMVACGGPQPTDGNKAASSAEAPLFELVPAEQSGLAFANQIQPNFDFNILEYNYFYNGGGVAVADFNADGLLDVFFTGNMCSSAFYLNRGGLQFEDVTAVAGLATSDWMAGVTVADVNTDGWPDLYVCAAGYPEAERRKNKLFIHQGLNAEGIPTFAEEAEAYGIADTGYTSQAAFFDYDRDGDLDLYLATAHHDKRNPNLPRPKVTDGSAPSTDRLYQNQSEKCQGEAEDCLPLFKEVSRQAGIVHEGYGLGLAIADFNADGWPDIFVSNDFIFNDLLYINNQDGTFSEQANSAFSHQGRFGMGTDAADLNSDGRPEIVVLDMLPNDNLRQKQMNMAMNYDLFMMALDNGYQPQYARNTLQLNSPDMRFREIGQLAGIHQTDWSWSALFADFDLDGQRDLFISNGIPKDITDSDFIMYRDKEVRKGNFDYDALKQQLLDKIETLPEVDKSNFVFQNKGGFQFADKTADWGLKRPSFSHGAVAADLDNDGDLELLTNNLGEPALLYRNQAVEQQKGNFLKVKLNGNKQNPYGTGGKVHLKTAEKELFAEFHAEYGFQSVAVAPLHFGLGNDSLVQQLRIKWPDGSQQDFQNVAVNQTLVVDYRPEEQPLPEPNMVRQPSFLRKAQGMPDFHPKENPFVDFKFEPLLPYQYSQLGPALAVADVNADGLDDFFLGGAVKENGRLFVQRSNGTFSETAFPDENYEDTGALFFDADGDGDPDLYVVSGGNEYNPRTAPYQDRLYMNDGNGNFLKAERALPQLYSSGKAVQAADIDQDGDLDLFVGGRVLPGNYPLPAYSAILRNDNGQFKDVTQEVAPMLTDLGLVSAALFTDFNADGAPDLLLAGEWMPLTFLQNEGGKFKAVKQQNESAANSHGWWFSLAEGDFDGDGDMDYLAGNLGLNSRWKATPEQPLEVWAKDFDKDGSLDAVMGFYQENEVGQPTLYPIASRDALINKMNKMRKRFPTYLSYAQATFAEVITPKEQQDAYHAKAVQMASCYVENLGGGQFALRPLPVEAQFAPLNALHCTDLNADGHLDVIAAGNLLTAEHVTGWHDASDGLVLFGDGNGQFKADLEAFRTEGEVRHLALLRGNAKRWLLVVKNGAPMVFWEVGGLDG